MTVRRIGAHAMARCMARRYPKELAVEQRKKKHGSRLYLDVMRNSWGQNGVLPNSFRAEARPPVATPLGWDELGRKRLGPRTYHPGNVRWRLGARNEPWSNFDHHRCSVGPARRKPEALTKER